MWNPYWRVWRYAQRAVRTVTVVEDMMVGCEEGMRGWERCRCEMSLGVRVEEVGRGGRDEFQVDERMGRGDTPV